MRIARNPEIVQTPDPRQKHSGVTAVFLLIFTLLLLTSAHADINDGLVGHWSFDEGSGLTAADSCGKDNPSCIAHDAVLQNGVLWINQGIVNGAVQFNAPDMAVSANADPIGVSDATITVWIKPDSIPYQSVIVSNNSNGFKLSTAQSFQRLICTNDGVTTAYAATKGINVNVWQFVVAERKSDGTCTMYVNGLQSGLADQNAGVIKPGTSFYIGRRPAAATPFSGFIDDVRVYNRILTPQEIMGLYVEAGGAPPPVMHQLTVSVLGSGEITSDPAGIDCAETCSISSKEGTSFVLTATTKPGSTFTGWSGACSGTGTCVIDRLITDSEVKATFTYKNPPVISGNTVTAFSCDQYDVQAAIDMAKEGDTVLVPEGSCQWTPTGPTSGAVLITKGIIFKGQGINKTNITLVDAPGYNQAALVVSMKEDLPFRVTGFTFNGDGSNAYIVIYGNSKHFRIDHISNRTDTAKSNRMVVISGDSYGVVDHIESNGNQTGGETGAILVRAEDTHAEMTGNTAWMRPLTLGDQQAVFIEDSTFTGIQSNFTGFASDVEDGGKIVFRNNTITNMEFGSHGAQSSGGRGPRSWEVYNNTFILDHPVYSVMVWARGGTGVIFNNKFIRKNGAYGYYIAFDNPRSHTAYSTFGSKCDGTNPWDGNEDATGYPCLDQIGRSTGDPGHESYEPAYVWGNINADTGSIVDPVVINYPSDEHIKLSRDYFSGVVRPNYSPYVYPHPLRISGFTSDEVLTGDVSGDGRVTMHDAALLLRYISLGVRLGDPQKQANLETQGDFNDDGKIDMADVVAIARKALGL